MREHTQRHRGHRHSALGTPQMSGILLLDFLQKFRFLRVIFYTERGHPIKGAQPCKTILYQHFSFIFIPTILGNRAKRFLLQVKTQKIVRGHNPMFSAENSGV